jgi:hypothetical protein
MSASTIHRRHHHHHLCVYLITLLRKEKVTRVLFHFIQKLLDWCHLPYSSNITERGQKNESARKETRIDEEETASHVLMHITNTRPMNDTNNTS